MGSSDGGERFGEKSIACKNGDSFPVDAVAGGSTAAEVVVIHAGKIVMDEGVGVNAFDGTGGGQGEGFFSSHRACGGETENGSEAFSSCQEAVTHGFVDDRRVRFRGDQAIESFFDDGKSGFPEGLRVH